MAVFRVEIGSQHPLAERQAQAGLVADLREAGLKGASHVSQSRLFFLEGLLTRGLAEEIADHLLVDPVTERASVLGEGDPPPASPPGCVAFEVHLRPGVMDPVAQSTLAELRAERLGVENVRTARRYVVGGALTESEVLDLVPRVLANDCIEQVVPGTAGIQPSPRPPRLDFSVRRVALRELDDAALAKLSRDGHLFLSLAEMRAIQAHFRTLGREPTDLELETLAQTWSEHCVHKTLRSTVVYRGLHMPNATGQTPPPPSCGDQTRHYDNLLADTIVRATEELMAEGRGPACLSVFKDNAGVVALDEEYGLAFKVETHNHPSAIEPYGGAATGVGGVIRDVIGCGLGARPIANTDVFCVGPADWPQARLPKGVLHPWRVLRGVVRGVADYGNRMGIPTVDGAVYFDPRYLGNPLVFCGCVGLIPRGLVEKQARAGDLIVLIGGRTGRDGIHGATFSSAELTDTHADEFSHAVQIGNAITEKRFLDAVLQARDDVGGCLYTAITDCGAGGLSSAVGEMGEETGAVVDLERVPLKYAGLRYDEIWISEAQERMVVAVPAQNLERFLKIMQAEEVEATVIGAFGSDDLADGTGVENPRLAVRFEGTVVGDLQMRFLHEGLPRSQRVAEWRPTPEALQQLGQRQRGAVLGADAVTRLAAELRGANVASREWIVRQYDHEVQGGSVVKALVGPGRGPSDAAVLRPHLSFRRGVAVGCGMAPRLSDIDPYWMAVAAIDEALRNVVCVGGDPAQTAILDNFCWGRTDDRRQLGALVRACQACYDVAKIYGLPFVSGKDSLNNEFALDPADVEPLLETLRERARGADPDAARIRAALPEIEARIRDTRRLVIPPTLLISAISIIDDVTHCLTPDLKSPGERVMLVGGLPEAGFDLQAAASAHAAVAALVGGRLVTACHDVSDGGWLVAAAEMALAGARGLDVTTKGLADVGPFEPCCAGYLVAAGDARAVTRLLDERRVRHAELGVTRDDSRFSCAGSTVDVTALAAAWQAAPRQADRSSGSRT